MTSRDPQMNGVPLSGVRHKLIALTAAVAALVGVILIVTVHLVVDGAAQETVSRVLIDRTAEVTDFLHASGDAAGLEAGARELEPDVAVYDATGELVAGTVPTFLAAEYGDLARVEAVETLDIGEIWSLRATPFSTDRELSGVVVAAERLQPYEGREQTAFAVSLAAAVLMVLVASAAAAWMSRRALAPVQQMAATAEEWSEHDLDRRFDLGPPGDEIRALGRTLDGLLDKVARAIRAEQRLTGELAHELRTPLTTVMATTELVEMRDDLDDGLRADLAEIRRACRSMSDTMTVLLDAAREQDRSPDGGPGSTTTGSSLAVALREHYGDRRLELQIPASVEVWAPLAVVTRAIIPLVDNALAVSDDVRVTASATGLMVSVVVSDDGPGISEEVRPYLFAPGVSTRGGGLGLALARRVARNVGGEVVADVTGPDEGARFTVTLPGRGTS